MVKNYSEADSYSGTKSEVVKRLLASVDDYDLDTYITFFTNDAVYQIGNTDPIIGIEGIRKFVNPLMHTIKSIVHDIKNMWEIDSTVICEVDIIYTRRDDKVFRVPNVNIIYFKGNKISKLQAFLDASEVFS